MRLADVLKTLPDADQLIVHDLLERLRRASLGQGRWARMVHSLHEEPRVRQSTWKKIIDLTLSASEPDDLARSLVAWARRFAETELEGPKAKPRFPLTRITSRDSFINGLTKQEPDDPAAPMLTVPEATQFVDRLLAASLWRGAVVELEKRGFRLARYTMWATFDPDGRSEFASLISLDASGLPVERAVDVVSQVGLDYPDYGGIDIGSATFVVFEYEAGGVLPEIDSRIPTVVEALTSDLPNYYFQPAYESETDSGWTMPWPNGPISAKPRPEVVHAPSSASGLTRKFEELR
jgi:hypothetical protein